MKLKYDKPGQCAWCGARARTGRINPNDRKRYSACGKHRNISFSAIPKVKD